MPNTTQKESTNSPITAKLTMRLEQWGLLSMLVNYSIPHLPQKCWEVGDDLKEVIETALSTALEEEN